MYEQRTCSNLFVLFNAGENINVRARAKRGKKRIDADDDDDREEKIIDVLVT